MRFYIQEVSVFIEEMTLKKFWRVRSAAKSASNQEEKAIKCESINLYLV